MEFRQGQEGLVTITKVETSKDMKWAKIWISIFNAGSELKDSAVLNKKIMDFLAKNIYDIQGEVNKHFHTKIIPRISFHLDTSPRYAQHIEELVKKHKRNPVSQRNRRCPLQL